MIDNFETNRVVLYLRGVYMMHIETTCHGFPFHVSRFRCVTFQSFPNSKSYGPAAFLKMFTTPYHASFFPCHMPGFTCHLSRVTCQVHMFNFLSFLLQSGGVSLWMVYYPWGLPHLVFRLYLIKNVRIPKMYLSWLVVVRFWSSKKASLWHFFSERLE